MRWYVGATDIEESKVWRWGDVDDPVQVNIWDQYQPDYKYGEHCTELRSSSTGSGDSRMNNIECTRKYASLCEYEFH
jgi:hypothetical protein